MYNVERFGNWEGIQKVKNHPNRKNFDGFILVGGNVSYCACIDVMRVWVMVLGGVWRGQGEKKKESCYINRNMKFF